MSATLTFHGGAGTVTGANFLLETGTKRLLIDCGIQERERVCDTENYDPFPYAPDSIDVLLVTHAHADHIGRIPKLVRDGFRGDIYSTAATRDLSALMFEDALGIMLEESKRHGCPVLYQHEDIERTLARWKTHEYHGRFSVGDTQIEFSDAGHILGSAMISLTRASKKILFTGDLGNSPEPLLYDTESPEGANYLVADSVYGDRVHEGRDSRVNRLRELAEETKSRQGILLIPSFSIERTQILLFELNSMVESGVLTDMPVYLDAPLAIRITEIYRRHLNLLNPAVRERIGSGDDPFSFKGLKLTPLLVDSHAIFSAPDPKIIIAGAGMSHGGRIREHEQRYLPEKRATVLFVGYQAPGSLGRRIQDGEKRVEIDGHHVRVRARIETISGYSGHKDRDALMDFVEQAGEQLEKVFVVMGEPKSSLFFAQRIRDFLGVDAVVPEKGMRVELDW